jgi:hypothetical protein
LKNDFTESVNSLNLFSKFISLTNTPFELNEDFIHKYDFDKPNKQLHPLNITSNDNLFYTKNSNIIENEDLFQDINHKTLFTSLVSKTVSDDYNIIEKYFDLPDLPNNMDNYNWQIPNNKDYEWINYETLLNTNVLKPKVLYTTLFLKKDKQKFFFYF